MFESAGADEALVRILPSAEVRVGAYAGVLVEPVDRGGQLRGRRLAHHSARRRRVLRRVRFPATPYVGSFAGSRDLGVWNVDWAEAEAS